MARILKTEAKAIARRIVGDIPLKVTAAVVQAEATLAHRKVLDAMGFDTPALPTGARKLAAAAQLGMLTPRINPVVVDSARATPPTRYATVQHAMSGTQRGGTSAGSRPRCWPQLSRMVA